MTLGFCMQFMSPNISGVAILIARLQVAYMNMISAVPACQSLCIPFALSSSGDRSCNAAGVVICYIRTSAPTIGPTPLIGVGPASQSSSRQSQCARGTS